MDVVGIVLEVPAQARIHRPVKVGLPLVFRVEPDQSVLAAKGRRGLDVDLAEIRRRGGDVKTRDAARRRRTAAAALARVRARVLDEIAAVEVIVHFPAEIVEDGLAAELDRMVAGPIGRVVLDDPRFFRVVLNKAVGTEQNLRSTSSVREPGNRVVGRRAGKNIFWTSRNVGRAVLRLIVGDVEQVEEIAGAVAPLPLEARLARGQQSAMAFDGIAAKVAQIALTPGVPDKVEGVFGVHEEGQLAEVQSLVEIGRDRAVDFGLDVLRDGRRDVERAGWQPLAHSLGGNIEIQFARNDRAAKFAAELLAIEVLLGTLGEEWLGDERLRLPLEEGRSVKLVTARLGNGVEHAARRISDFRAEVLR